MLGGDKPEAGAPLVVGRVMLRPKSSSRARGDKVVAFKKKRRKNTHRKRGHRQHFTKIKITAFTRAEGAEHHGA